MARLPPGTAPCACQSSCKAADVGQAVARAPWVYLWQRFAAVAAIRLRVCAVLLPVFLRGSRPSLRGRTWPHASMGIPYESMVFQPWQVAGRAQAGWQPQSS